MGHTVGQLEHEYAVAVIAQRANGTFMLHPHDESVLSAGDQFVVSASLQALNRLARLTPPTHEYEHYLRGRWAIEARC